MSAIQCDVVLPMAGVGQRFASQTPKQFHLIHEQCVYFHTLMAFVRINRRSPKIRVHRIVLTCRTGQLEQVFDHISYELHKRPSDPTIVVLNGRSTRHRSIFNGLTYLSQNHPKPFTVIHDGVRPIVDKDLLLELLEKASIGGVRLRSSCLLNLIRSFRPI
jgi:2-C-methyl-D-erythritol 4-phosphate cytidylyltransferase